MDNSLIQSEFYSDTFELCGIICDVFAGYQTVLVSIRPAANNDGKLSSLYYIIYLYTCYNKNIEVS